MRIEKGEDSLGHLIGEGEAAKLIVHHGHTLQTVSGISAATRETGHCTDEVSPVADDPARAHNIVRGTARHGQVAGSLGLPVNGKRRKVLAFRVILDRTIKDVVRAHMHERDTVLGTGTSEKRWPRGVGTPADGAALRGLRTVDGGVGSTIDYSAIQGPVKSAVLSRIRKVELVDIAEVEAIEKPALLRQRPHGTAKLTVAACDKRACRRHGNGVGKHGMALICL